MLSFSDVRYILKPESVITNNFPILSHTLTLGIPKYINRTSNIRYKVVRFNEV